MEWREKKVEPIFYPALFLHEPAQNAGGARIIPPKYTEAYAIRTTLIIRLSFNKGYLCIDRRRQRWDIAHDVCLRLSTTVCLFDTSVDKVSRGRVCTRWRRRLRTPVSVPYRLLAVSHMSLSSSKLLWSSDITDAAHIISFGLTSRENHRWILFFTTAKLSATGYKMNQFPAWNDPKPFLNLTDSSENWHGVADGCCWPHESIIFHFPVDTAENGSSAPKSGPRTERRAPAKRTVYPRIWMKTFFLVSSAIYMGM